MTLEEFDSRGVVMLRLIAPRKVMVTREGVAAFNDSWPGSLLSPARHYWFEFESNGDLIDYDVPEHSDGACASALSMDCAAWLESETTPDWCK